MWTDNSFKLLTLAMHIGSDVELSNIIRWRWLDPDTLPDSAARCVEYMRLAQSLLSNWNYEVATIGGVMNKDKPIRYQLPYFSPGRQYVRSYSWLSWPYLAYLATSTVNLK